VTKMAQLNELVKPAVDALGYELWGLEFSAHGKQHLLRIYIDAKDGIGVDDCTKVSHQVSALLDVEDPIRSEYTLEVSSPGMDRPLFTLEQFTAYKGHRVKVKLRAPFEGRRNFAGTINGVEDDDVLLVVDEHEFLFPIDSIDKANIEPQFK